MKKIRDEKLQCNINRKAAKTSALSSRKTDKYEYLTGKEVLPFDHTRTVEHAKFSYSSIRKAFKKSKIIEDQGKTCCGFTNFKTYKSKTNN